MNSLTDLREVVDVVIGVEPTSYPPQDVVELRRARSRRDHCRRDSQAIPKMVESPNHPVRAGPSRTVVTEPV